MDFLRERPVARNGTTETNGTKVMGSDGMNEVAVLNSFVSCVPLVPFPSSYR